MSCTTSFTKLIILLVQANFLSSTLIPENVGGVIQYENITKIPHNDVTEICCNDKINKKSARHQQCCHSSIFDITKEACCNGQTYSLATHTCCKNNDRSHFYSELYMSDVKVVEGKSDKFCCGQNVMDDEYKQLCCGGIIYANDEMKLDCCGINYPFDVTKQICCPQGLRVVNKSTPDDDSCCNGVAFNTKTQLCCHSTEKIVVKSNIVDNGCCNGISYNLYSHICCNNVLVDLQTDLRCCNDKPYNFKKQICCGGKIMDTKNNEHLCCNNELYNYKTEICCNETIFSKESGICCFHEWREIFHSGANASVDQCCGFNLLKREDFGTVKEYCCRSGNQRSLSDDPRKGICCGLKPYNNTTEVCCGETVIRKSNKGESFCCVYTVTANEYMGKVWEVEFKVV